MRLYDVKKNIFGRWIIVHPANASKGWTGMRWSGHCMGIATGQFQIANFGSEGEAHEYATENIEKIIAGEVV